MSTSALIVLSLSMLFVLLASILAAFDLVRGIIRATKRKP
jgi:hypothetical protein